MKYFKGKSFIVTGASSGIGKALAITLAKYGANVTVISRNYQLLKELKEEAAPYPKMVIVKGDVTRELDCKKAVTSALNHFDKLDGIIHNAGISMRAIAEETSVSVYKKLIEVNYYSLVYFYKYSLPALKETKGHFCTVSSMQGRYSTQIRSGYAASKHAVQGFMDSVRLEVKEYDVHVMTASPGYVNTCISMNALTADGRRYSKMDPGQLKGLEPEEAAVQILSGLKKKKRDVYPAGFKEKFALLLSRISPSLLDRILLKSSVT